MPMVPSNSTTITYAKVCKPYVIEGPWGNRFVQRDIYIERERARGRERQRDRERERHIEREKDIILYT